MRKLIAWSCLLWMCGCGSEPAGDVAKPDAAGNAAEAAQAEPQPASAGAVSLKSVSDPTVRACLERAETAIRQGELGQALEALSQAIGQSPECAEAYALRGRLYAELRRDADAVADFSTAIRFQPQDARYWNARGYFLLSRKHTTSALQDLNAATKLDPKFAEPYNHRGLLLLATGEVDKAVGELSRAIELDPKYIDALNNRGIAYLQANRPQEALADLDAALAADPNSGKSYNNRGLIHFRAGQYDEALADFTKAIMHEQHNAKLYDNRRQTYTKLGRFAEAQSDAAQVKRLVELAQLNTRILRNPRQADLYVDRGRHFVEFDEDDKALANFERAIAIDSNCAAAYASRAALWMRRENFDNAITDCTQALRIEPSQPMYSLRGDAYMKVGDYASAISDFEAARRIDEAVAEAYRQHAHALRQAGHEDAARQALEHAAAINPAKQPKHAAKGAPKFDPAVTPAGFEQPAADDAPAPSTDAPAAAQTEQSEAAAPAAEQPATK